MADAGDAAIFATPDGEPLQRKGRPPPAVAPIAGIRVPAYVGTSRSAVSSAPIRVRAQVGIIAALLGLGLGRHGVDGAAAKEEAEADGSAGQLTG